MSFSNTSKILTKRISSADKKGNGIYFTPPNIITKHLEILKPYLHDIKNILEPSCGSCEYIRALQNDNHTITGVELNDTVFDEISTTEYINTTLIHANFLEWEPPKNFDLIIGNPPYYVMKKDEMPHVYSPYYTGRPNIFTAFIVKCLGLLNENGVLGFVLPTSFLNCIYYDKLRKYISTEYEIIDITGCEDGKYIDTEQETFLFTVRKSKPYNSDEFVNRRGGYTIYNTKDNIRLMKSLYEKSTNLNDMGMNVNVGTVVWNQKKDKLTDDAGATRLIYSSDIKDGKVSIVKYKNLAKKNYINEQGHTNPLLVINRGYGKGKYKFNYCIIDMDHPYLIENHLICISPIIEIGRDELLETYDRIIQSFEYENTTRFIDLYFGNNAINTTELKYILPIY